MRGIRSILADRYPWVLVPVLCIVAVFFYARIWPEAPVLVHDSPSYFEVAQDLRDFHLDSLHDRTPGYPSVLLLIGAASGPTRLLFFVQMGFHVSSILVLLYVLRALGVAKPLMVGFGIVALFPAFVAQSAYITTESTTELLLVLGAAGLMLWLLERPFAWLALSGIALGLSGLTRPTYQLLFIVVPGLLVLAAVRARGLRSRLVTAAGLIFAVGGAMICSMGLHNAVHFGYPGLTPRLGFTLATRTARVVERLPETYGPVRDILIRYRDAELTKPHGDHTGVMYIWDAIPDLERATWLGRAELSRYMMRLNLVLIRKAPLQYLRDVLTAAAHCWFPFSNELLNRSGRSVRLVLGMIHVVVVMLFLVQVMLLVSAPAIVAILGNAMIRSAARSILQATRGMLLSMALAVTIVLYTVAVSSVIEVGNPRYRTPTDLLILLTIVLGFAFWRRARGCGTQGKSGAPSVTV